MCCVSVSAVHKCQTVPDMCVGVVLYLCNQSWVMTQLMIMSTFGCADDAARGVKVTSLELQRLLPALDAILGAPSTHLLVHTRTALSSLCSLPAC